MNKGKFSLQWLVMLASVGVADLLCPPAAQANTCIYNFSYYDDVYFSSDGSTIYSSVSVVDNSGCNHSQYTTTAKITSPSGRNASASESGLSATAGISLDGETGNFSMATNGTFYCPFIFGFAGFGNGWSVASGYRTTYYQNPTGGKGYDCDWHSLACTSGTPSCANGLIFGIYTEECPEFMKAIFPVLVVNGEVEFCDPLPERDPVTEGGPCT